MARPRSRPEAPRDARQLGRESKRLALIERVLDAASDLFGEQGYDGTKVSEVCARSGIAYGTFFNHFPEKRDLVRGLAERSLRTLTEELEGLSKERVPLARQLAFLFEESAARLDPTRRDLLGQIWSVTLTDSPHDSDRRFHAAFEAFLAEGVARGQVRDDVPVETLAEIVGSSFSNMTLSWAHLPDYPIRERAAATARLLADALAPRPAASRPRRPR